MKPRHQLRSSIHQTLGNDLLSHRRESAHAVPQRLSLSDIKSCQHNERNHPLSVLDSSPSVVRFASVVESDGCCAPASLFDRDVLQSSRIQINQNVLHSRYYTEECKEWRGHLRDLAPEQYSSGKTSQWWQVVDKTLFPL